MNILLTSAGRRTYMIKYFKEALYGRGLVYASNSMLTYALLQADKYVITPNIYDKNYIEFLIGYCQQEDVSVVLSLFDIDLPVLAMHKKEFAEKGITIVVSDYEVTQICNDKWLTYKFLSKIRIPQVPTYISATEVQADLSANILKFPLILKPRWGMGSIGIYKVDNVSELNVFYEKLRREILETYLKYESEADINSCILIQQMIKGQEYGIEILDDLRGNYVTTFAKRKIAMRSGETDIAETVETSDFVPIAKEISANLKHIGNLDVDCFKTSDGRIIVLEMNCRFGGQYPFTHNAGVNVPQQIIEWLDGNATDMNLLTPKIGIRSCKDLVPVIF